MKKEDVEQKIRTRIDTLGSNLQGKGISLSDDFKQQLRKTLSKEVLDALRIKFRREVHEETKRFFAELEKDLGYSFKKATKDDVWCLLLADVGLLDGKKSSDVEQEVSASDTGDEHAVEVDENHAPLEAEKDEVRSGSSVELLEEEKSHEANLEASSTTETEETQVSDEDEKEAAEQPALVEEAKSPVKTEIEKPRAKLLAELLAESRSQKPWTKRCDDPEIIRKVNEIIVKNTEHDEEKISRDAYLRNDLGMDSLDLIEIHTEIDQRFSVFVPDHVVEGIKTVGDVYDAAAYYVKQKKAIKRNQKHN